MTSLADFPVGTTVVLTTFHLATRAPRGTNPAENYWRLIGKTGTVVGSDVADGLAAHAKGPRALVRFEVDVGALGLRCHNRVANSLYLFLSDLQRMSRAKSR